MLGINSARKWCSLALCTGLPRGQVEQSGLDEPVIYGGNNPMSHDGVKVVDSAVAGRRRSSKE
jgi:hypothetical protein